MLRLADKMSDRGSKDVQGIATPCPGKVEFFEHSQAQADVQTGVSVQFCSSLARASEHGEPQLCVQTLEKSTQVRHGGTITAPRGGHQRIGSSRPA